MILSLAENMIVPQSFISGGGGYVPININNVAYNTEVTGPIGSKTISFTTTAGDNRAVYLVLNLNGGYDAVSAAYAGEAMTKRATYNKSGFFSDCVVFEKINPIVGLNDFVISFGAAYDNPLSWYIIDLANTSGYIQNKTGDGTTAAVTAAFDADVAQGSLILAAAVGLDDLVTGQEIELPQGVYTGYDAGKYTSAGTFPGKVVFHYVNDVTAGAFTAETNSTSTGANKDSGLVVVEIGRVV